MTIEELRVVLSADDSKLKSGIRSAKKEVDSFVSQSKELNTMFDGLNTQQLKDALKQTENEIKILKKESNRAQKEINKIFSGKQKGLANGMKQTSKEIEQLQNKINKLVEKEIKIESGSLEEQMKKNGFSQKDITSSLATVPVGYERVADGVTLTAEQAELWKSINSEITNLDGQLQDALKYYDELVQKKKDDLKQCEEISAKLEEQKEIYEEIYGKYEPWKKSDTVVGIQHGPLFAQETEIELNNKKEELYQVEKEISALEEKQKLLQDSIEKQNYEKQILEQKLKQEKLEAQYKNEANRSSREALKNLAKQNSFLKKITRLVRTLLIMRVLRSLASSITRQIRDCYNTLILFDKQMNGIYGYNKSISDITSGFKRISAAISVSAAELLNALAPAIMSIISKISAALDLFNQFLAAISGKSTYTSVKADFWQDYSAGIDGAQSSAEKLKRTVMGFDELNKLNGQDSGGGSSSTSIVPSDMFEEKEIGGKAKALADKFNWLKEKLSPVFKFLKDNIKEIGIVLLGLVGIKFAAGIIGDFLKVADTAKNVVTTVKAIGKAISFAFGDSLGTIALVVAAIALVVAGFITMYKKSDEFRAKVDSLWNDTIKPAFERIKETAINLWENYIKPIASEIGDLFSNLWNNILAPILAEVGYVILAIVPIVLDVVNMVIGMLGPIFGIIEGLIEAIGGVVTFLRGVFTVDMKVILDGLKQMWDGFVKMLENAVKAIANVFISIMNVAISAIEGIVRLVINGLNFFLKGVTKAVNSVGNLIGSSKLSNVNWNIDYKPNWGRIPYLAEGGIVSGRTLAYLGENNKKEAVLPLERNTEWVDMLASKLNTTSGSNDVKAELTVDGQTFGWLSIKGINNITSQTGRLQLNLV